MAHLNHRGPEDKGPKTGRKLGLCKLKKDESLEFKLGEGRGMRKNKHNDSTSGKGKRLKSYTL
jgi:hypothetical protein